MYSRKKASCRLGTPKSACGYCKLHRKKLTTRQLKNRKCLSKGCFHLVKYERHGYWKQRERIKKEKKERKRNE